MSDLAMPAREYPIDCIGDAITGDRGHVTEAVLDGCWRRPKCVDIRTIEAKFTADSYGAERQQPIFSLCVLLAEGTDAPISGSLIQRKGQNLRRRDVFLMPWANETAWRMALNDKHNHCDSGHAAQDTMRARACADFD